MPAAALALWLAPLLACGRPGADPETGASYVPAPRASTTRLEIEAIDKIDVLFVVDSSGSMRDEQAALAEQFPLLARALSTGDIDADGEVDFPPPRDVQLGVVSADMGLPAVEGIPGCEGLGDDAVLGAGAPRDTQDCRADLPGFVRYQAEQSDLDHVASDFACLAALGTGGCGFEQQLEATLKALWPGEDARVGFHGIESPTRGHGDGENAGFSRSADGELPSLLVVVLITDEDDCSASDLRIFTPDQHLDPGDPLADQDLNLRCFHNADLLYPIERYHAGLRELRPGAEQLVVFAAIAGVPPDLVDAEALDAFDYADAEARDVFYARVLDDSRMQSRLDDNRSPEQGGNLLPVCEREGAVAYPARRITQLAQHFGDNGIVQSICDTDRGGVLGFILERIANRMNNPT